MATPQSTHPSAPPQLAKAAARFWSKVDSSGECWLWTGSRLEDGYGSFWVAGRSQRAHRVAYQLTKGLIPDGMQVCHDCPGGDNPSCVNPAHLFVGTNADNARDMANKGRAARVYGDRNGSRKHPERLCRGERNPSSKLTADDVRAIRAAYAAGATGQKRLAKQYAVDTRTIAMIVHRVIWAHID